MTDQETKDELNELRKEIKNLKTELEDVRIMSLINTNALKVLVTSISQDMPFPKAEGICSYCGHKIQKGNLVREAVYVDHDHKRKVGTLYFHSQCIYYNCNPDSEKWKSFANDV